jgi:hypothetical protein
MLLKLVELVLADPVDGSTKSITSPAASPTTPEQRSTLSGIGAPSVRSGRGSQLLVVSAKVAWDRRTDDGRGVV